jgi:acyl carrier protein
MNNYIKHFCKIANGQVILDEVTQLNTTEEGFDSFMKLVYKKVELNYPKFYKMDPLCKLSILGSSILLDATKGQWGQDLALVFSNKSSCIDIDLKHQSTIRTKNEYYPSPANFVYTLPNIALGEISIKYKLKSESSFFIFEKFNHDFMIEYANSLIQLNKASSVLCGWVEVSKNDYQALFYLVSQDGEIEYTKENLLKLKCIQMEELKTELKQKIINSLNLEDISVEDVSDNDYLFGEGLGLDSIDALELIVMLDKDYGIKLTDPKEGKNIFQSIESMAKFIEENRTK